MRKNKLFKGVYNKTDSPRLKKNESIIINIDDPNGPGTHWTALYNKNNTIYYFDSYGFVCPQEIINLYSGKNKIIYSDNNIQSYESVMCGFYCIDFIKEIKKGKSFYDYIYQYDVYPSKRNEIIIRKKFNLI